MQALSCTGFKTTTAWENPRTGSSIYERILLARQMAFPPNMRVTLVDSSMAGDTIDEHRQ